MLPGINVWNFHSRYIISLCALTPNAMQLQFYLYIWAESHFITCMLKAADWRVVLTILWLSRAPSIPSIFRAICSSSPSAPAPSVSRGQCSSLSAEERGDLDNGACVLLPTSVKLRKSFLSWAGHIYQNIWLVLQWLIMTKISHPYYIATTKLMWSLVIWGYIK